MPHDVKGWGLLLFVSALTGSAAAEPALCDLVVGRLERHGDSLIIAYQNQGAGLAPDTPVSLRICDGRRELLTLHDQAPARQPLEIRRSDPVPFQLLQVAPRGSSSFNIYIDPLEKIPEANEINNEYTQSFQPSGNKTIYPSLVRYAGWPDLAVDKLAFVAPHNLEATVVNRGKGMTLGSYHGRFKVNGVANELQWIGGRDQPLPRPGQFHKWLFNLQDLHVNVGESAQVEFVVDPERRVPDPDRGNNRRYQLMKLGNPLPTAVPFNKVQGDLNEKDVSWSAAGCFANWIEAKSSLNLAIFPFALKVSDLGPLLMDDAMTVLENRCPGFVLDADGAHVPKSSLDKTPFAELILTFPPGTTRATMKDLLKATWRSGTCNYSGGGDLDKEFVKFRPFQCKPGALVDFQLHKQLRGQVKLNLFPKVEMDLGFGDPLPDDVPPCQVRGIIRFGREVFKPASVVAYYRPDYQRLDLVIWDQPLEPREMTGVRKGWWAEYRHAAGPKKLEELQVYIDLKDMKKPPHLCLVQGESALNSDFQPKEGGLWQVRAPKLGQGLPVTFRIRGRNLFPRGQAEIDLAGAATMFEVR